MSRLGMQVSIFNWLAAITCLWLVGGGYRVGFAIWVLAVQLPLIVGTLLLTYRPLHRRWIAPLTASTNAMAGLTCVAACFWSLDRPEVSTIAVVVASQFASTVFPLRFQAAFASAPSFVAVHEVLVIRQFAAGELSWARRCSSRSVRSSR